MPPPPLLNLASDALFLDLDGTLTPIRERPDDVMVEPAMLGLMHRLGERLGGRLAVISGRSIEDLKRLLPGMSLCLAGIHGLERCRADADVVRIVPTEGLERARVSLLALADRMPGLLLEDKGLGLALHYRQVPQLESAVRAAALAIAKENGLVAQTGKMVIEVRGGGADKGAALAEFMAEPPFIGSRPLFVGDDDTDEAGFAIAKSMGGHGILVGPPRRTVASFGLADVAAVDMWLAASLEENG